MRRLAASALTYIFFWKNRVTYDGRHTILLPRPQFVPYMPEGRHGMIEYHSRTDIAHHPPHLLTALRRIAMDFTLAATRFIIIFRTAVNTSERIVQQRLTFRTYSARPVMSTAIDSRHLSDDPLFSILSFHIHSKVINICAFFHIFAS